MAPTVVLIGSWLLLRLIGLLGVGVLDSWVFPLRGALAAMFLLTAVARLSPRRRSDLIAMVPPSLPRPALLVSITGVLEVVGAAGLLLSATARPAAACLALVLVLMFPANVHAARVGGSLGGRAVTPLLPRTAMQILFAGCCVAVTLS